MSLTRIYPSEAGLRHLPVGQGHTLAYRCLGQPGSEVWLVLHGGPGSGASPALLHPFDLSRTLVLLPDQRGCGRSTPRGGLRANTLPHLVKDLEALRLHLGLRQWNVLGGSWGATLALAYAAACPAAVSRLVLRGAFDASARTTRALRQRFWPGPSLHMPGVPDRAVWQRLSQLLHSGTPRVTQYLSCWTRMELAAAAHGAQRAMRHLQGAPATLARRHWKELQRQLRRTQRPSARNLARQLAPWRRKFRIQARYLARRCHLRTATWAQWLGRLRSTPVACDWVHGRFDAVCPPQTSQGAHGRLQGQANSHNHLWLVDGGHLPTDPAIVAALRRTVNAGNGGRP